MKKNITPVFAIVSLIIFSVYLVDSLHTGDSRSFNALIAKAQAAGAQEATQGRYFHQKTKTTTFANSAASNSIEPIRIDESWYDTQSAFSMDFQRDEATGKIIKGFVTTQDKIFELNDAGTVVYETRRDAKHVGTSQAPFDVNKIIGQGFKDYLNDPDHKSLNVLFPQSEGMQVKGKYLGLSHYSGKEVEALSLELTKAKIPGLFRLEMYFDKDTFGIVAAKTFLNNQAYTITEFLAVDYSDIKPAVSLGNLVFRLGD